MERPRFIVAKSSGLLPQRLRPARNAYRRLHTTCSGGVPVRDRRAWQASFLL